MLFVSSSEDDKVKSCVYLDFFGDDCFIDDTDDDEEEESEDVVGCWFDICFLFMIDGDEDVGPGCTGDETGVGDIS